MIKLNIRNIFLTLIHKPFVLFLKNLNLSFQDSRCRNVSLYFIFKIGLAFNSCKATNDTWTFWIIFDPIIFLIWPKTFLFLHLFSKFLKVLSCIYRSTHCFPIFLKINLKHFYHETLGSFLFSNMFKLIIRFFRIIYIFFNSTQVKE